MLYLKKQSSEMELSPNSNQGRIKRYIDRICSFYQLENKLNSIEIEKVFRKKDHEQKLLNQMVFYIKNIKLSLNIF